MVTCFSLATLHQYLSAVQKTLIEGTWPTPLPVGGCKLSTLHISKTNDTRKLRMPKGGCLHDFLTPLTAVFITWQTHRIERVERVCHSALLSVQPHSRPTIEWDEWKDLGLWVHWNWAYFILDDALTIWKDATVQLGLRPPLYHSLCPTYRPAPPSMLFLFLLLPIKR